MAEALRNRFDLWQVTKFSKGSWSKSFKNTLNQIKLERDLFYASLNEYYVNILNIC